MPSIRQNPYPDALPDFRNLGVMARVLIVVNLLALAAVLVSTRDFAAMPGEFVLGAALIEPPLVASLALLYATATWLRRMSYGSGCAVVIVLVLVLTAATQTGLGGAAAAGGGGGRAG